MYLDCSVTYVPGPYQSGSPAGHILMTRGSPWRIFNSVPRLVHPIVRRPSDASVLRNQALSDTRPVTGAYDLSDKHVHNVEVGLAAQL